MAAKPKSLTYDYLHYSLGVFIPLRDAPAPVVQPTSSSRIKQMPTKLSTVPDALRSVAVNNSSNATWLAGAALCADGKLAPSYASFSTAEVKTVGVCVSSVHEGGWHCV